SSPSCTMAATNAPPSTAAKQSPRLSRELAADVSPHFLLCLFVASNSPPQVQSTNMNSFESSNTCAYFSQGLSGLGGGSGGPLKSFFAFHSPAYSLKEPPAAGPFDLMTGDHLKSSLFRFALKSTTKSIVSPILTSSDSIFVSALSLCSVQLPNEPARLETTSPRMPSPSLCSCASVPLIETTPSRGAVQRRITACRRSFPACPPSAVSRAQPSLSSGHFGPPCHASPSK